MRKVNFIFFVFASFTIVQSQSNPPCQRNWTYFSKTNKCFQVFGGAFDGVAPTTWSQAEEYCGRFHGGHLASFHSDEEVTFVVDLAHQDESRDDGNDAPVWIGLFFSTVSNWGWSDGSPATYYRWCWEADYYNGISAANPAGFLITKRVRTGTFATARTGGDPWPFVCQTSLASETPV